MPLKNVDAFKTMHSKDGKIKLDIGKYHVRGTYKMEKKKLISMSDAIAQKAEDKRSIFALERFTTTIGAFQNPFLWLDGQTVSHFHN